MLNLVWSFCRFFVKLLFKPCFFRLFCEILGNCHFYFFKLQTKSNLLSETLIIENRSIFFFFFDYLSCVYRYLFTRILVNTKKKKIILKSILSSFRTEFKITISNLKISINNNLKKYICIKEKFDFFPILYL